MRRLVDLLDRIDPVPSIFYAKEKFAELRVGFEDNATPFALTLVEAATAKSRETCQECGAPGAYRRSNTRAFRVLCDEHAADGSWEIVARPTWNFAEVVDAAGKK